MKRSSNHDKSICPKSIFTVMHIDIDKYLKTCLNKLAVYFLLCISTKSELWETSIYESDPRHAWLKQEKKNVLI